MPKRQNDQFVVPGENQKELIIAIGEVASSFGMNDQLSESKISGGFAYFLIGDTGSYFMIGARTHHKDYNIDVSAYEAGIYDKEKFTAIEAAMADKLKTIYGNSVTILRNPEELVALERTDT